MILDEIIRKKKEEVRKNKINLPLNRFKSLLKISDRDFKGAVSSGFNLIAEIKKGSPSKGIINKDFDMLGTAEIYQRNKNVRAVSVLTDYRYFYMAPTCLKEVKKIIKKPLLRKDFIIDSYQVYESRYLGADAILLIARILSKEKMKNLIKLAKKYKMDCLVEIHDEKELKKLPDNVEIIGINNRNLDSLKVDLKTTLNLIEKISPGKIIVSESGYNTKEDIKKVKDKVNAVLIGTSILKSKNIDKKINELMK